MNLVEFFTRFPELLEFFKVEIENFVNTDKYKNSLYPPIYPMALIITRLLPYDLKNHMVKHEDNELTDDKNN